MDFKLTLAATFLLFLNQLAAETASTPSSQELTPTQAVLSSSPAEKSTYSETVRFVVRIVPTYVPGSSPSGSVQFYADKKLLANQPLVNNVASFTISSLEAMSSAHRIQAVYSGDQTYAKSSDLLDFVVLPANTAIKISSNASPANWGEETQFTVQVSSLPPAKALPQGSIQFRIEGHEMQTLPLNEKGIASFSTADMEVGQSLITASFKGDSNVNRSSASIIQVVQKAATTTSLTSSENPLVYGKALTIGAQVTSPLHDRRPTGEVQFQVDGHDVGGPAALNASGEVRINLASINGGDHKITAHYLGDAHFVDSKDLIVQRIEKAPTKSLLAASANPAIYGSKVTVTDTLTSEYATPSGIVEFAVDGISTSKVPLNASGNAYLKLSDLESGKHTIRASYLENPNFLSTAEKMTLEIDKAETSTSLTSSENPTTYGSRLALTAFVSSEASAPKGSVQFSVDEKMFETKRLDGSGRASIEIALLDAGERKVNVNYLGSTNFKPSSASLTQQVKKADTEISLISSQNPSTYGSGVSFSAAAFAPGVKLRGSVRFLVDGKPLETKILDVNSRTSIIIPRLEAGEHIITADFLENQNFNPSSTNVIQSMAKANTAITLRSSDNPASYGSDIVIEGSVISPKGKPTGFVALYMDGVIVATNGLDADGVASFKISNLVPGSHELSGAYLGDTNFSESNASLQQTVEGTK